ncbi:unnamed protein product [Ixodes pacificus]
MKRGDRRGDGRFEEARPLPPPRLPRVLYGELFLCLLRGTLYYKEQRDEGRTVSPTTPKGDHSQKQQRLLHFSPVFFSAVEWCRLVRKTDLYCSGAGSLVLSKDDRR